MGAGGEGKRERIRGRSYAKKGKDIYGTNLRIRKWSEKWAAVAGGKKQLRRKRPRKGGEETIHESACYLTTLLLSQQKKKGEVTGRTTKNGEGAARTRIKGGGYRAQKPGQNSPNAVGKKNKGKEKGGQLRRKKEDLLQGHGKTS